MATSNLTYDQVSAPGFKGQFNYVAPAPVIPKFNVNSVKDVPTLNNALKMGQINKNQYMQRLKQFTGANAPAPPTSLLGKTKAYGAPSLSDVLNRVVVNPGKSAGKAVIRPGVALVTGNGGQAAHDVAQLSSDVTGGTVNQLARALRYTPQAVIRETQNKPITDVQKKAFGTTNQGGIVKKILGSTVGTASLAVGGGEAAAVKNAGRAGAKALLKKGAINVGAGVAGNVGSAITQNPNASKKELAKSAIVGAALGAGATGAEAGLSKALQLARQKVPAPRSALDNHTIPTEGETPLKSSSLSSTKSPAETSAPVNLENGKNISGQGSVQKANTKAIDSLTVNPKLGESGSIQVPKTNDYVKEQIKLQDQARKAGSPSKISTIKSEAKTKLLDSFAPIEDTLNKSGAKVAPENNIKYQIDRTLRADTIGAQYIKDNGLAKVIQSAPNVKELDQYLIAKHAPDLEKQGINTGRNAEADKQLLKDLSAKYEQHAQAVKEYSQNLLDKAVDYGLVGKDVATSLKEKYPNYVPVNRIFSDNEASILPKGTGGGKVSIASQSAIQKIKGSNRQIESPLSSLIDKTQTIIKEGERNKSASLLASYKDLPGNPFQLKELGKDEQVGVKPVISYLDEGKVRRFQTTPEIAAAAKSLNKEQLGLIGRILTVPTRILRLGATGLNPAFALSNVAKDTASAFINSSHPLRASVANPKVFVQALKAASAHGSKEYAELVREGAGGTSFDIARNAPKQNVRNIRMQKNLASKILYTATNPAQLLRAAENTIGRSEEFNRSIQYFGNKEAALKKGLSAGQAKIVAADAARNNTVNFARAGEYGRVVNSALPYMNAGIQGSRTLLRNLKDRPLQTTTKLAVTAFFPTAAITAWNVSDPKRKAAYDDIKDYEKQGNLVIVPPHPVKDKNGKWNVIKIPVSQEIANLNNVVREGVEAGVKDKSINVASLIGNAVGTVTSLNTQSPRQLTGQLTPQAVKPGIEALTNQNLFTGNKIVPDSQKNLSPRDQTGPGTSKVATKLGTALNVSPREVDNTISTTTGGLGTNVTHGKGLSAQLSARFKGAQGQSKYDLADARFAALKTQLNKLPEYKSMNSSDKAKALNRLQSQVTAAYIPSKDSKGKAKTLTSRQVAIKNKPDLKSYLKSQKR